MVSYGLDLAGFSAGKSALARATFDNGTGYDVVVYRIHPFSKKLAGRDRMDAHLAEVRELIRVLRPFYIDVPLDLQGLPTPENIAFIWQLTRRPIDFAFGAIPPLADRLGTPVARMRHVLQGCDVVLNRDIFETYPAACLKLLLTAVPSYKGTSAEYSEGTWIGDDGLVDILQRLKVTAPEGTAVNDDFLDAAICALTGVVPPASLLLGEALTAEIRRRLEKKVRARDRDDLPATVPEGYVLFGRTPLEHPLRISVEPEWLRGQNPEIDRR